MLPAARLALALLLVAASGDAQGAPAPSAAPTASRATAPAPAATPLPRVLAPEGIEIDAATQSGTVLLEFSNDEDRSTAAFDLHATPLSSFVTHRRIGAIVRFADATAGEGDAKLAYPLSLGPHEHRLVRAFISNMREAGAAGGELRWGGKTLAPIVVVRSSVPLSINVGNASVEKPARVEYDSAGVRVTLELENADDMAYWVDWQLELGPSRLPEASGQLTIPSKSAQRLSVPVDLSLFPGPVDGLLRDIDRAGTLQLKLAAHAGLGAEPLPRVSRTVSVRLARHSELTRGLASFAVLFVLLAVGGVASLFLNFSIPNGLRRAELRQRLAGLARRIRALPDRGDVQLSVELRVQRRQIADRIAGELSILPATAELLEQAKHDVELFEQRMTLIEAIEELCSKVESLKAEGPPRLLEAAEQRLFERSRLLVLDRVSDFSVVREELNRTAAELEQVRSDDAQLRATLLAAGREQWNTFELSWEPAPEAPDSERQAHQRLRVEMGRFVARARRCFEAEADANEETLSWIDMARYKLDLISDFIRFWQSASTINENAFRDKGTDGKSQIDRFFQCLSGTGLHSLSQARIILRQAEQGIFVKDIGAEIGVGAFRVDIEPQSPQANDVVVFRILFNERKLNGAAALDKVECSWTFRHPDGLELTAKGWCVRHYFRASGLRVSWRRRIWQALSSQKPRRAGATVNVSFRHGAHTFSMAEAPDRGDPAKLTLHLRPVSATAMRDKNLLEFVQLGVALAITLGALISGAREQLEKLDLVTGIVAVIALGFGADVVKNLISRRAPA